ncbi:MAG: ribosome silencing factor, partial [Flavobacteriales bacterium]
MGKTKKKTSTGKAKPTKKKAPVKKAKKPAKPTVKGKATGKGKPGKKPTKPATKVKAIGKNKPGKKPVSDKEVLKLVQAIIDGMEEKKGEHLVCLDLRKLENRVCDFFVVCEADNIRKVKAVCDSVEEFTTKKCDEKPWHVEGLVNCQWVLMDYVNVVAHIFYA